MTPLTVLAVAVICIGLAFRSLSALVRHTAAARRTGLPYLIIPMSDVSYTWQALVKAIEPLLRYVPIPYIQLWMDITDQGWHYKQRYKPFKHFGSDTFMTASPERLYMCTADPAVVNQIASRRIDFPKPSFIYEAVDLYGTNVVSTNGAVWQRQRKIASPAFSEALNGVVWEESINQANSMMAMWGRQQGNTPEMIRVENAYEDLASLSLGVLSYAGFGVKLFWPGEDDSGAKGMSSLKPGAGYHFSFKKAMGLMLNGLIWIIVLPRWLLRFGPVPYLNDVEKARIDCRKYFEELRDQKSAQLKEGDSAKVDILSRLVNSAHLGGDSTLTLSNEELIGNFFIMYFGGHETTAISLFYTMALLAISRSSQKAVQSDLDQIFKDVTPAEGPYSDYITALSGSMLQAALMEQLRLISPVVAVPKCTDPGPVTLTVDGKEILLPQGTFMHFNIAGVHRNEKYWPHRPSTKYPTKSDIDEYIPERWVLNSDYKPTHNPPQMSEKEALSDAGGSKNIYHPPRGVFLAFSEGQRACLGKRFAQTEILAVLSSILKAYTIELDVGEWASDQQLNAMTTEEKNTVYEKACSQARYILDNNLESLLTLQMKKGKIPLRFVPRGKEIFTF